MLIESHCLDNIITVTLNKYTHTRVYIYIYIYIYKNHETLAAELNLCI